MARTKLRRLDVSAFANGNYLVKVAGGRLTDLVESVEAIQDIVAAMFAGTHTGISFAYDDSTGVITATVTGGGGSGTTKIDQFTATAGQTAFTATSAPTVGTLRVKQNGIDLASADYSLSGTTVTLTTGAPAGDIIRLVYDGPGGGGGGGGSGPWGRDPRWTVPSGSTRWDDFEGASLDPAWVRVDEGGTAGNVAWNQGLGVLSNYHAPVTDSFAHLHALLRPLSGVGGAMANGDGFITHLAIGAAQTNYTTLGLVLTDGTAYGAGNQYWWEVFHQGSLNSSVYTNFNSRTDQGALGIVSPVMHGIYLRLSRASSTTWNFDFSSDYVSWVRAGTRTWSPTPTHIGFVTHNYGSSQPGIGTYQFLDRVAGVA